MSTAWRLSGRIPELDGVRGLAIALVLFLHLFNFSTKLASFWARSLVPFRLSWTGVDLFFVLSGFLIGGILLDARESTNYFRVFYVRRFFRIVPIYVAVLLIFPALLFFARICFHGDYTWLDSKPLPWYSFWTFTQNFWMARTNSSGAMIIAVTWSLAIEEQFYLTLPTMVRFLSRRWLIVFVISGICIAPTLRTILLFLSPHNSIAPYVLMPCRADALLFGVLAAILVRDDKILDHISKSRIYFYSLLLLLALGMAFLTLKHASPYDPLMQRIGYTWVAFFYASVLIFVLAYRESFLSAFFRNKPLRWLGGLAYGVYLLHRAIYGVIFGSIWGGGWPYIADRYTFLAAVAALAITLLVASLSWRYFELPLIRVGHKTNYELEENASPTLIAATTR
jgi:peptidoglycan/LPS O-acetylase OafA/YrhL